ncbi:glycerophosphodiester phosphodiesterase family protein [Pukyongiella litopenaei]|uniref:Glycerophosphodiester phosphodiesterase n=1 Tax=Pukyongiella litopenaei TaxID=2605946 RepID=A0A2S0MR61_9RHOB|nr:glycerophosphodiester phosphodiesterase family protein [Pukyongiella litopenaei]AVO38379.1 glycerophosphodiester phosphodiesterase [Pukyongiella litopenaei]
MTPMQAVRHAYGVAWARRWLFGGVYLVMRLAVYAVIAPVLALLVNLAVSLSNQSALTDQDIAAYIFTPGGMVVTIGIASLLLVAEVLIFAALAALLRFETGDRLATARAALGVILSRLRPLLVFAGVFLLRVLLIALPFLAVGGAAALWLLGDYDINYYLSTHPPEFLAAVGIGAVLLLALAVVLLLRLSSWALALHLVLFADTPPVAAFAASAARMRGKRTGLKIEIVLWLLVRTVLMVLPGLVAGVVLNLVPLSPGNGLRVALALALIVAGLWALAATMISGLALAALAALFDRHFAERPAPLPDAARSPGGLRRRGGVVLVALGVLVALAFWTGDKLLERVTAEDDVVVIAHRGAAGLRPENTMASVEQAIADGADWVEIDVQETVDGRVVVMHDSDFMKLSGIDLKIWDATMDDLAGIDIGSWFDPAYADQRVPLLRDVLAAARGRANVLIELKYYGHDVDLENRVIGIVEELGMQDRIATMSLKYPAVQKMLTLRPGWRTGVLAATAVGDLAGLQGDFIAVNTGAASVHLARMVEAAGKDLYVWTVNDPLQMSQMISMGADGLITDQPALARQVLEARAGLNSAERLALWLSQQLGLDMNVKAPRDDQP